MRCLWRRSLWRVRFICISLAAVGSTVALGPISSALADGAGASIEDSARDQLVEQLIPLQIALRENADAFGGLWLDEAGRPVVAAVDGDPRVRGVVNRTILTVTPLIVSVPLSAGALDRLHAAIAADRHDLQQLGIQLAAVETDTVNNAVVVTLVNATPDQANLVASRYGPGVVVRSTVSFAVGNSCLRTNCPNPLKAGLDLYVSGNLACTGGFIMRSGTSTYYWTSAGHCQDLQVTYQHPAGVNVGAVSDQGWVDNSKVDVELFHMSSAQASNVLFLDTDYTRSMTSKEDPANEVIGEGVCMSGMNGLSCGTLKSVNVSLYVCRDAPCTQKHWITDQRRASYVPRGGDSGAPIFYSAKAMGIESSTYPGTTDGLYGHIRNVEIRWNLQTQLTMP